MASLIDAYTFTPATFTPSKRTTFEEALKSVDPLIQSTAKSIGDYNNRTARQTEINDAIAAGNAGWYDENDPATVAAVEEYVRTGNSGTLQNLKNAWQNSQDRIANEAKAQLNLQNAEIKAENERKAAEDEANKAKDYNNRLEKAKYDLDNQLAAIENNQDPNFDKGAATQEVINNLFNQGFEPSDIYSYLNQRKFMSGVIGEQTKKSTAPKAPEKPQATVTIHKKK